MSESIELIIEENKKRLDSALAEMLEKKGFTRSRIQKLISEKRVTKNGKEAKASEQLKIGDKITIDLPEAIKNEILPLNFPLKIWYEDENLFVVEKPANMVTHPAYGHNSDTLVNVLLSLNVPLSNYQGKERAGIVHRLDKETSGLLVVAKDEQTHQFLSRQFSERTVEKEYLALVWGTLPKDEIEVSAPLKRDLKNRKRICVAENGKNALTIFQTIDRLRFITLIKAKPKTGRTHQIRVHLAHIKHPIVGDFLYGGHLENGVPSDKIRKFVKESGRFFLHAHKIVFENRKGKKIEVVSPLPKDFVELMEIVKNYG
ncbi:MAG: RluA family pseudouridine synthase [Acidobacteria bacterium]|nr:RluA family pseudouridine synthase [Acidobacteriota bacterium]